MGRAMSQALLEDPEVELAALIDPAAPGERGAGGLAIAASVDALSGAGVSVAVDFTVAEAAMENARWCASQGVSVVLGTTGIGDDGLEELRTLFTDAGPNCVIAPNFSVGAVILVRLAEMAAPYFDSVEIVELHHDQKADAPSGTAIHTADRLAGSRRTSGAGAFSADPTRVEVIEGARGAVGAGGIHVHSVRLRGLVAHEEVLLGTTGQSLSLRHDSYDRTSFAPGVLMAVKSVLGRPGLTVGLEPLLGF